MLYTYLHVRTSNNHMWLKNMIAALYSSRRDGTKEFSKSESHFGWYTIGAVYRSDLTRAQDISRRVPGLKYSHVVCDSWTRLNVLPAKIMQVCCAAYVCDCGIVYVFNYSNLTCLLRFVRWPTRMNLPNGVMYAVLSIWKLVI